MAIEFSAFIELADFLRDAARTGPEQHKEALFRTAIGRAYYGAFGHARKYAQARRGFKSKGDAGSCGFS